MDPLNILAKFYDRKSKAFEILVAHGRRVACKALGAADSVAHLKPDLEFIFNAAMLHDIGILHTDSPGFGCKGKYPYVCHGYLGREMLDRIWLPQAISSLLSCNSCILSSCFFLSTWYRRAFSTFIARSLLRCWDFSC